MAGIQLSAGWAVAETAGTLSVSSERSLRKAGKSLRCCEVTGLEKLQREDPSFQSRTQGVRISLRFYRETDLATVSAARDDVASGIAKALGLWDRAVQIDVGLLEHEDNWLGLRRPYQRGGSGLRLDRYLTTQVLETLETRHDTADWRALAERPAEVKILLRRLRYRLGADFGSEKDEPRYAYWTTKTTEAWAEREQFKLEYLVHKLSINSNDLISGHATPATSLDTGFWGEVDTEADQLQVRQLTTGTGTTVEDIGAVLDYAGKQISHCAIETTGTSGTADPVAFFIRELEVLLRDRGSLKKVDVLLVHRGGGLDPASQHRRTNVPVRSRRKLRDLCRQVRDLGVEVVVALGHANISVLTAPGQKVEDLPLGIFEATTPTAGAAWILQEHINPRLVDTSLIYRQPSNR